MFRVDFLEDCNSEPLPLFDSRIKTHGFLWGGDIRLKYDETSAYSFNVYPTHALYDRFNKGKQEVIIRDGADDRDIDSYDNIIFRARIMKVREKYSGDGSKYKIITIEGIKNTLLDWVVNQSFTPASSKLSDIFTALNTGIHIYSAWPNIRFDAYNLRFENNEHSDFVQGPYPGEWSVIADDGSSRFGDTALKALRDILKDVNAFLKERHYVTYDSNGFKLNTVITCELKYPNDGTTGKTQRLILGKHVGELEIETDFSTIVNDAVLDGTGKSGGWWDTPSMETHGPRFNYKRDRRYTVQESMMNYVREVVERYKNPETSAVLKVTTMLPREDRQKKIELGGLMAVDDAEHNQLYWGFITEIVYNLNSPLEKTVYLDRPSANLWKGSMK